MPKERLAALRKAFEETLRDPAYVEDARKVEMQVRPLTHQQVKALADEIVNLPPELIAQQPAAERSGSRLLDGRGDTPVDRGFRELPALLSTMRASALEHGRDPDAIEMTTGGNGAVGSGALDEVKALAGKKRFPGLLAMFARLGEQTGQLPQMLDRAARQLSPSGAMTRRGPLTDRCASPAASSSALKPSQTTSRDLGVI